MQVRAGVRFKLRVVLTEKKGAGVLADEDIPSGQFVIEYIGEVGCKHSTNCELLREG